MKRGYFISLNKVVKKRDISQIVLTNNLYEFTAYYVFKAAGFYNSIQNIVMLCKGI